jgi:hypothetical protein
MATEDTIAGEDDRPVRPGQEVGGVIDRLGRRLREVRPRLRKRSRLRAVERHRGEVLRQLDVCGPRLFELGDTERLADDLRNRLDALDARIPLGHGIEHPDDVDDLVRFLVELVGTGLAGQRDERRAIEVGVGDAGHEVGCAGSEGGHRDRRASGQAPVDVGHECRALLVAGRNVANPVRAREGVENVERLLAGHREDPFATLCLEAFDEQIGGGPSHRLSLGGHQIECSRLADRADATAPIFVLSAPGWDGGATASDSKSEPDIGLGYFSAGPP